MGQKLVMFSDLTGKEMKDGEKTATVIIEFSDKRRGIIILDALAEETENFASKGRKASHEELVEKGLVGLAERVPRHNGA